MKKVDVVIIGAGWSGLLACKYALQNKFSIAVLERRGELGGVWNFSNDPNITTVMDSTITSSSATVTEASDFPMTSDYGNFVHRKDIQTYLNNYTAHFDLNRHIYFNQQVKQIDKKENWVIRCQDETYGCKFLVVCSGLHQQKQDDIKELYGYTGQVTHIGDIKSIAPGRYCNKDHVLVYGGGESASDVVDLLVKTSAKITWSIPAGQHFFRKAAITKRPAPGQYRQTDAPLDEASSKCIQMIAPFEKSKPGMRWLCNIGSTGSVLGYEGHGIPEWKKSVPFMHAFINKNGHAVEYVYSKRVKARGKITSCKGLSITFGDGGVEEFNRVIVCTGYKHSVPFLPVQYARKPLEARYKLIFEPEDPTLLFIGLVRPIVSSIPLMTELQCMYAFQVLRGNTALPAKDVMLAEIQSDIDQNNRYFHHRHRPGNLVCPFQYGYEVANLAGVNPNYAKLFIASPVGFLKTFFSPMSAAHFLLNDKTKRKQAIQQIWTRQSAKYFVYPWIYLIARILRVDAGFDYLAERRYRKQVKKAFPQ